MLPALAVLILSVTALAPEHVLPLAAVGTLAIFFLIPAVAIFRMELVLVICVK